MSGYLSVFAPCVTEKVIERSRFIAHCAHTENEEQARAFIASIREEHSLATHNCFAFVADKTGNLLRFSDDGEPQGTAGMPILEVLKSKKLFETAVVVTRYFGGIKLGAGGLVRAYSGAAADVLAKADIRKFCLCTKYTLSVGYDQTDFLKKFLDRGGFAADSFDYADSVSASVFIEDDKAEKFVLEITDAFCGRIKIEKGESMYAPLSLKDENSTL